MFEWSRAMFDGRLDPNDAEWGHMVAVTTAIGNSMRLPISVLILAMAIYVYRYMKGGGTIQQPDDMEDFGLEP